MARTAKPPVSLSYRLGVVSRLMAATVGGYCLASLCVGCLALGLGLDRGEAVLAATLPAFLMLASVAVWVFAARSAGRAWLGVMVPALLLWACRQWLLGGAR